MFETFKTIYLPDDSEGRVLADVTPASGDDPLDHLFELYGGKSFNHGMYRVIETGAVGLWGQRVSAAFPSFEGRVTCFGIDWLGRVFALDRARQVCDRAGVVLLEPGTGEALEMPCDIVSFHETELIQYREEALAESFYKQWVQQGGTAPRVDQCIGYKRPLFLGGLDTVDNLELADLDVYWDIAVQLLRKTRGLPLGTPVQKIDIQ